MGPAPGPSPRGGVSAGAPRHPTSTRATSPPTRPGGGGGRGGGGGVRLVFASTEFQVLHGVKILAVNSYVTELDLVIGLMKCFRVWRSCPYSHGDQLGRICGIGKTSILSKTMTSVSRLHCWECIWASERKIKFASYTECNRVRGASFALYWTQLSVWSLVSAMDNLNGHSEHANQPQGQQANGLPLDGTNPATFHISFEQHRLQLDQVLQLYNEQVCVSQQQEITAQKTTLLNLLLTDALIQKDGEIARLHMELQRKQENLENARQLAVIALETNDSLLRRLPPVQQETNSHVSSNEVDAPGSGDEATSVLRTVCPLCNAVKGDAVETRFG